jgi:hypothetical protein
MSYARQKRDARLHQLTRVSIASSKAASKMMDCRVKPGNDSEASAGL